MSPQHTTLSTPSCVSYGSPFCEIVSGFFAEAQTTERFHKRRNNPSNPQKDKKVQNRTKIQDMEGIPLHSPAFLENSFA